MGSDLDSLENRATRARIWPSRKSWIFLAVPITVIALTLGVIVILGGFKSGSPQLQMTPGRSAPPVVSGVSNCAASPSSCGFPDATNTGIKAGVALKSVPGDVSSGPGWHWDDRGWVVIDGSGAVFSGYVVNAPVNVAADNVTVENVKVTVGGEQAGIALVHSKNAVIKNNEVGPASIDNRLTVGVKDVYGDASGTQILSNNIFHTSTGVQTHEGLIQDNYIHDMGLKPGDHINGTTSNGSTVPMTIRHNTILNQFGQTDAVSLFQDFGVEANRVIDNNLLAGGGYTIYAGQNPGAPDAYNIKVTNNRISRMYFPNGGSVGPLAAYNATAKGNVWSGNVWDENSSEIPLPK